MKITSCIFEDASNGLKLQRKETGINTFFFTSVKCGGGLTDCARCRKGKLFIRLSKSNLMTSGVLAHKQKSEYLLQ